MRRGAGWQVRTLAGHSRQVRSVAISADGMRVVSGSVDQTVKIWDVETGPEVRGGCSGVGLCLGGRGGVLGISRRFRVRVNSGFSSLIFSVAFVLARRFTPVPRKGGRLTVRPLTSREVFTPSSPLSLSLLWVGLGWVGLVGWVRVPVSHWGRSAGLSLGALPGDRERERERERESVCVCV